MTSIDIARQRLASQHIARPELERPADVVQWLGAVQAQDYAAAKWALGLRSQGLTDADIEQAFADGAILRTHVMRPTWHFVTPADIRWMPALSAPRVSAANAYHYRRLGLDDATFTRSNAILAKALRGRLQLTRPELVSILQQAGMATDGLRFTYLMMRAELDGIICSGARRGKQFTYALLDERAPRPKILERDEALAELAKRYFTSHGPATLQDFVWWSGLAAADARAALEMIKSLLMHEVVGDQTYWFAASIENSKDVPLAAHLLPNFDEYIVGYADRSASFDAVHTNRLGARDSILSHYTIAIHGQIVGTWKRTFRKGAVVIASNPFTTLTAAESEAVNAAAHRYGEFLGMPVVLT